MDLPGSPLKNPDRVPAISQVLDPVGQSGGPGPGVQITPSLLYPSAGQRNEQEALMSERNDIIEADGVYEDGEGNRFQYRAGHQLARGDIKARKLKKVGAFPSLGKPGEAEHEATKADAAPENKAEKVGESKK